MNVFEMQTEIRGVLRGNSGLCGIFSQNLQKLKVNIFKSEKNNI